MMVLCTMLKIERYVNIVMMVLIFVLSSIACILPHFNMGYPWCLNVVPMASAFIFVGYLIKLLVGKSQKLSDKNILVWGAISIVCVIIITSTFRVNLKYITINNVDMASSTWGHYLLYMIDAVAGILMLTSISVLISRLGQFKLITFIGANTMTIFLTHKPVVIELCRLSTKIGFDHWIMSLLTSIAATCISCLIAWMINKLLPAIVGNKK